jgi:hypothetical protein
MLDLDFKIDGAQGESDVVPPLLCFKLRLTEGLVTGRPPTRIQSASVQCQIQIEPARRRYSPDEQARLFDLFGLLRQWGQTLRPFLWTTVSVVVPSFVSSARVDLLVPCGDEQSLGATAYFEALENGEVPLCFLFRGMIFYENADGNLQFAPVSWNKEAYYRLPVAIWKALSNTHTLDRA